jgi:hypothetical protein
MRHYSPGSPESTSESDPAPGNGESSEVNSEAGDQQPHGKRRRRRIKIRKRIRIKKKPSTKKKVRKMAETFAWVAIVIGFIVTMIIMIRELDIKDEKFKQQQKLRKATQGKK